MIDWMATWLLNFGGDLAHAIFGRDLPESRYDLLQMMFATLTLAAIIVAIIYFPRLVNSWVSRWKTRK
jgi:hypothetical protein